MKKLISYKKIPLVIMGFILLALSGSIWAQEEQGEDTGDRDELTIESPIPLNPAGGSEIGFVYQAYLSPQQEGGEEEETPALIPPEFRSTEPSVNRNERTSRGHAVIEFTRDLSRAYVFLAVENVDPTTVNLLHLHCGRPGQLGPIIVDFGMAGNVPTYLEDGTMSLEITNEDIVAVTDHGHSLVGAFTAGCAIASSNPADKVRTIAGLQLIAEEGELYFNLHTRAQTYFGDMRGQFSTVDVTP